MSDYIVQVVEFKNPVSVIYEGVIAWRTIKVVQAYILRSGKPSHVVDEAGEIYDFHYIDDKDLIYRTIIRNLMFKELI